MRLLMVRRISQTLMGLLAAGNLWSQNNIAKNDSIAKEPDQLLWYRGKKKNDTTLIMPTGTVVRYSPSNNNVEVKLPPKQDPFQPLVDELSKTGEREEEVKAILLKGQDASANYQVYKEVEKAYEHEKAVLREVTSSKLELPKVDEGKKIQELVDNLLRECPQKEQEFNEIADWVKQHKKDQDFDLPVPPDMDYEHCWDCDPKKQDIFDAAVKYYAKDFFKEEIDKIKILIEFQRKMILLGFEEGSGNFHLRDYANNPSVYDPLNKAVGDLFFSRKKTACSWMPSAMHQAPDLVLRLIIHANEKAVALFKKYRKDFHHLAAVTRVLLVVLRQKALISGYCDEDKYFPEIAGAFGNFLYDFRDKFKKPDYYAFANTRFYFQLARQYMLLGGDASKNDEIVNWYLKYNRFKLHFDIDCKQGSEAGYILAHVKGDNHVRIVPDSAHCIAFEHIETGDHEEAFHPIEQNLKLHLEAADFVTPAPRPVYVGTREWQTTMPDFRLHLCDGGKDTLIVHTIFPKGFKETWNMPGMAKMETGMIQSLLLGCFIDEGHAEEEASAVEAHAEEVKAELQRQAAKMQAETEKYKREMAKGKAPSPEQVAKMQQMGQEMMTTSRMTKSAPHAIGNYFFPVTLKNDKTMIEETLDGKKLFPDNEGIIYALFRLQLIQDPKK